MVKHFEIILEIQRATIELPMESFQKFFKSWYQRWDKSALLTNESTLKPINSILIKVYNIVRNKVIRRTFWSQVYLHIRTHTK